MLEVLRVFCAGMLGLILGIITGKLLDPGIAALLLMLTAFMTISLMLVSFKYAFEGYEFLIMLFLFISIGLYGQILFGFYTSTKTEIEKVFRGIERIRNNFS